jgi:hypothetical protein
MSSPRFVILSFALLATLIGCGGPSGFSLPKGAVLRAEASPGGKGNFSSFAVSERGRLFIYDADNDRLLYSGTVEPNNTVRLYPDGASVVPTTVASRPINEQDTTSQRIAQWNAGQRIRAYVVPIVQPEQNPNH